MTVQITTHDFLLILTLLSILILLPLTVTLIYKNYKKRQKLKKLKSDIKQNARDSLQSYTQRQKTRFRALGNENRGLNELTDDSTNTSVLNINKLLKANNSYCSDADRENGGLGEKGSFTEDTGKSYEDSGEGGGYVRRDGSS